MTRRDENSQGRRYGAELRRLRGECGASLTAAAAALGLSSSYLSEVELGRRAPLGRERDAAVVRELGGDAETLEVLRALDTGAASVGGLRRGDVRRVVRLVERLRARRGREI